MSAPAIATVFTPAAPRWGEAVRLVAAATRRIFLPAATAVRPPHTRSQRQHYPDRADHLETSRMTREMHRL